MANTYNCDSCGKLVTLVAGARRCEICTPKFCGVVHATWYPTVFDERNKTNGTTG
jgi:hypothetical protein